MEQPDRWPRIELPALTRQLQFLSASLATRNADEETAEMRAAVYIRFLSQWTEKAVAYMVKSAIETCEFFPSVSKCLDILNSYVELPLPRDQALLACQTFNQAKFDDFRATLKRGEGTPELLEGVPDQWKRICVEQGFLRWHKDRGFTIDPRYGGTSSPIPESASAHRVETVPREPTADDYRAMGIAVSDDPAAQPYPVDPFVTPSSH